MINDLALNRLVKARDDAGNMGRVTVEAYDLTAAINTIHEAKRSGHRHYELTQALAVIGEALRGEL